MTIPPIQKLPLVHETSLLPESCAKRAFDIALPFLVMYRPFSQILSVGLGGMQGWHARCAVRAALDKGEWVGVIKNGAHLCVVVTSVALTITHPVAGVVVTQSIEGGSDLIQFAGHLYHGDVSSAGADLGRLAKGGLYTAATVWMSPQLIVASLVAQVAFELIEAQEEWKKGHLPEVIAKIVMVALRTYQTREQIWDLYDEYAYEKIKDLQTLSQLIEENKQVDKGYSLQTTFKKHAYSSKLVALDLSEVDLSEVMISNLTFKRVNFNHVDLSRKTIDNVRFEACTFKEARCFDTFFKKTHFSHSDLTESNFFYTKFENVHFSHVNLFGSMWNRTTLTNVTFDHALFAESNFFLSKHVNTLIKASDLTNAIFADAKKQMRFEGCTEHRFTKPVVALGWECLLPLEWGDKIDRVIKDQGGIVFRFDFSPDVDSQKLDSGMQPIFDQAYAQENGFSIAQRVLAYESHKPLNEIKADAATIVAHSDGVIIPGSCDDVHWEFYRNTPIEAWSADSYGQDVYELAIVDAAIQRKLPLMGVCYGAQLINVYHGGTLHNVEGHCNCFQKLVFPPNNVDPQIETFREVLGDSFEALCLHDQGMERLGKGLKLLLDFEGVPKLVVSANGKEILSQFHPEAYIYWSEGADYMKKKNHPYMEEPEKSAGSWKALYTHFFSLLKPVAAA